MTEPLLNFIDGDWRKPHGHHYLDVWEPATGKPYCKVASSDVHDINAAVSAAASAFPMWSALTHADRAGWLHRLADAMEADRDALATAETLDTGKPIWQTRDIEIPRAVSNFRFFAAATTVQQRIASRRWLAELHIAAATRRRRLHLAMEFAAVSADLENRAGTCRRQYRRRQTIRK